MATPRRPSAAASQSGTVAPRNSRPIAVSEARVAKICTRLQHAGKASAAMLLPVSTNSATGRVATGSCWARACTVAAPRLPRASSSAPPE